MIRLLDYQSDIDDLPRGDTMAVCHQDCPAGEDVRYRLYLTKPASSPNVVLGYCHNCNESGVLKNDDTPYRNFTGTKQIISKQVPFDIPDNMVGDPELWPKAAHMWRVQKGLSKEQAREYGIQYDPATHRIFLPIYRYLDGPLSIDLTGYQLRLLDGNGPKYLTAQEEQDTVLYSCIRPVPEQTNAYVLVEDFASGIAVADAIHNDLTEGSWNVGILVNYGVKTKIEALNDCPTIGRGLVWLDNDGAHILDQSTAIAKTWHLVTGASISQNLHDTDPKQFSNDDIITKLKEAGLCK